MSKRVIMACLVLAGCSQQPQPQGQQDAATNNPLGLKMDERSAVGACMTPEEERTPIEQIAPERQRAMIGCIQNQAAAQIQPQLPQQVDPMTRLTDVTAEDTMLTYHQTVDVDAATVTPAMTSQLETRLRTAVCGQPQMRGTIDLGGGYGYRWSDKNGQPIHAVQIASCSGAGAAPAPGAVRP